MAKPANSAAPNREHSPRVNSAIHDLLIGMLEVSPKVSDLVFSPGRPPQVQVNRALIPVETLSVGILSADDTRRIASELIGDNKNAIAALREHGACDVSYGLARVARFRVNVFIQRGSCAVVMRVVPTKVPDLASLGLPEHMVEVADLRDGVVLVAGGAGSGKSSTLAALVHAINERHSYHIVTIENPIEFLHNHARCTIHQRELYCDTPSYSLALKAALRQSPNVIVVSEIRDRETLDTVLEAAETGHLVLSSLHTADSVKTLDRLLSYFPPAEHPAMRNRLARNLRHVFSQRLLPRRDGEGRVPAVEILKLNSHTRECIEEGVHGELLLEAMERDRNDGMQTFDDDLARLVRTGIVDLEHALLSASNPARLRDRLGHELDGESGRALGASR